LELTMIWNTVRRLVLLHASRERLSREPSSQIANKLLD
jgi:hypothetical protein